MTQPTTHSDGVTHTCDECFIAGAAFQREQLKRAIAVLEKIAKNKTEDGEIYTMGCDCDEEASNFLNEMRDV